MKENKAVNIALMMMGLLVVGLFVFAPRDTTAPTRDDAVTNSSNSTSTMATLTLKSPTFSSEQPIPMRFTCQGDNISPPLIIEGVPDGAQSLVLIVDDPDIPKEVKDKMDINVFDHWVLFNIPADTRELAAAEDSVGVEGLNSGGEVGYTGPCPPKQYEPTQHTYRFQLLALDTKLDLPAGASKQDVLNATENHVVEEATLEGVYEQQ